MPDPLTLARMRARRMLPVPASHGELAALATAVNAAARELIDVQEADGGRRLMLGWPTDTDPAAALSVDEELARRAPVSVLLTLAACIGCCWTSLDEPLYPSVPVPEERVLAALARFTQTHLVSEQSANGRYATWRSAFRQLRAYGVLGPDTGDALIRLGPQLAAWREADMRQLRDRYDDLPRISGDAA